MKKWTDVVFRIVIVPAALALASCGGGAQATSSLESRSGSATTGTALFEEEGDQVTLTLEVSGSTPGKHAIGVARIELEGSRAPTYISWPQRFPARSSLFTADEPPGDRAEIRHAGGLLAGAFVPGRVNAVGTDGQSPGQIERCALAGGVGALVAWF